MKKLMAIAFAVMATVILVYSCTKQARKETQEPLTETQAVQALVSDQRFVDFSTRFITGFTELMQYHRSKDVLNNRKDFLLQVQRAGASETQLAGVYSSFALSYDHAMLLKNKLDNEILQLLNQHPFLLAFHGEQVQQIILNSIDAGLHSPSKPWQQAREELNTELKALSVLTPQTKGLDGVRMDYKAAELSIDEVWGCLKEAVGFGTAGILGVAALTKLAQEGVQAAVIGVSKWIAARAGWFGIAIAVIDFGVCVYKEATD